MRKKSSATELRSIYAVNSSTTRVSTDIQFDYPEKSVHLFFFEVTEFEGQPKGLEGQSIRWVSKNELIDYQLPEANIPIVQMLQLQD